MTNPIPMVVLAGLLSGVAVAVVVTLLTPGVSPAPPMISSSVELTPILERLDRIELALRSRPRAPVSETSGAEDLGPIMTLLADIERRVLDLSRRVPPEAAERPVGNPLEEVFRGMSTVGEWQNWRALYGIANAYYSQHSTYIPGVANLTAPELARRFGSPDAVREDKKQDAVLVVYTHRGADGKTDGHVYFAFTGGRVTGAYADGLR